MVFEKFKTVPDLLKQKNISANRTQSLALWKQRNVKNKRDEGGMCMRFGFIGAGKVGVSLGKYFMNGGIPVCGYYSLHPESAKAAADFTHTEAYSSIEDIVKACDALILSVPDTEISSVYESVKPYIKKPMCLIHLSGLLTSSVFYDISEYQSYGYSVHPLLAVSSKYESYRELSKAFFTIEGDIFYLKELRELFEALHNPVLVLTKEQKVKYHTACVFASNLVVGLFKECFCLLGECGFSEEEMGAAIMPLALGNLLNTITNGPTEALTGPVERGDVKTVKAHREVLSDSQREIYDALSKTLVSIASQKHPKRDYREMFAELNNRNQGEG